MAPAAPAVRSLSQALQQEATVTLDGDTIAVGTAAELAVLLGVIPAERTPEVLEQLSGRIAELIADGSRLNAVLKALAPCDQWTLLQTLGGRLPAILNDARGLRDTLATLAAVTTDPDRVLRRLTADEPLLAAAVRQDRNRLTALTQAAADEVMTAFLDLIGGSALRRLTAGVERLADVTEGVYAGVKAHLLRLLLVGTPVRRVAEFAAAASVHPRLGRRTIRTPVVRPCCEGSGHVSSERRFLGTAAGHERTVRRSARQQVPSSRRSSPRR